IPPSAVFYFLLVITRIAWRGYFSWRRFVGATRLKRFRRRRRCHLRKAHGVGLRRSEGALGGRVLSSVLSVFSTFSTGSSGGTIQSKPCCSSIVPIKNLLPPAIRGRAARRKSAESVAEAFCAWPWSMASMTLANFASLERSLVSAGSPAWIKAIRGGSVFCVTTLLASTLGSSGG